jgi:hypothetical protein
MKYCPICGRPTHGEIMCGECKEYELSRTIDKFELRFEEDFEFQDSQEVD